MIFIFDWGYTTRRVIGPLSESDMAYPHSGEDIFYTLVAYIEWFRLFFIPTLPIKRSYSIVNMNDHKEIAVDKAFYDKYAALARLNQAVVDGKISEAEYEEKRAQAVR